MYYLKFGVCMIKKKKKCNGSVLYLIILCPVSVSAHVVQRTASETSHRDVHTSEELSITPAASGTALGYRQIETCLQITAADLRSMCSIRSLSFFLRLVCTQILLKSVRVCGSMQVW